MKIKEKLAHLATMENNPCSPDYFHGYLAGFEEAKAMTVDYAYGYAMSYSLEEEEHVELFKTCMLALCGDEDVIEAESRCSTFPEDHHDKGPSQPLP